jgi:hypothetical protein
MIGSIRCCNNNIVDTLIFTHYLVLICGHFHKQIRQTVFYSHAQKNSKKTTNKQEKEEQQQDVPRKKKEMKKSERRKTSK